ncbi:hypothetical protein TELCIR_22213, partial [Teladorsagia circumcincta]
CRTWWRRCLEIYILRCDDSRLIDGGNEKTLFNLFGSAKGCHWGGAQFDSHGKLVPTETGPTATTTEHLGLAAALSISVFVIISEWDLVKKVQLDRSSSP